MTLRTWQTLMIAIVLAGCDEDEPAPQPSLDGSVAQLDAVQPPPVPAGDGGSTPVVLEPETSAMLDVLFVVDNSGSMASEQVKLARELPRMVQVLTSGDRWAGRESEVPPGLSDKARHFTPVTSLHLGVVSTNFGGLVDAPPNVPAAVQSCSGLGDQGKLQSDTTVAVQGVTAGRYEFASFSEGEAVLPPDPTCALGVQPRYQSFGATGNQAAVGTAFSCVARLGVRGCPFEQPLESMWHALAPSAGKGDLFEFVDGASGLGDRYNAGFLRQNAALAVVVLSDEDDCSITEQGRELFALDQGANDIYGDINLRCYRNDGERSLVRAVDRYREGLLSLKPGNPRRVLFTAIAGVPPAAVEAGATPAQLLALPEMQFVEDTENVGFPRKVCSAGDAPHPEEAYPARRLVSVAGSMQDAGLVESICAQSYAPVIDRLVNKIAPLMGE